MIRCTVLLLFTFFGLASPRLYAEADGYLQPLSVLEQRSMLRLLTQVEQDLRTAVKWVGASPGSEVTSWPESHRHQLFELHSRTQRSARVLMLQVERLDVSTIKEAAQAFTMDYGAFSATLRELHRAVVMKENPADTLAQSQSSALQALSALQSVKSDIATSRGSR